MLKQNGFPQSQFPYTPLPDAAFRAVSESLSQFGFEPEAIEKDYSFSSTNKRVTVNALAFAHPSQRNLDDYAGVTVFNAVDGHNDTELVGLLAETSAPFHLIHRRETFTLWTSGVDSSSKKRNKLQVKPKQEVQFIPYDRLSEVLNNYAEDFKPQSINNAKLGREVFKYFAHVNPLQLSFWAEEIRSKPLVQYFEQAIHILREHSAQLANETVTNIATQLLGLLILADTGAFGQDIRISRPSLVSLIQQAHSKFPHYFDPHLLINIYPDAVKQAYTILEQIQYAGFVPDMLGDLYAVAYEKEDRKQLGNYDTPLHITRRILATIPIEQLPPHERVIADVTCGWGSFLISGYERITGMNDSKSWLPQQYIYGNDVDPFFVQLARLGLIYTARGDNWQINNNDVFQWQWLKTHQPNIIVGNPPFFGNRKQRLKSNQPPVTDIKSTNSREEKANAFLEQAIDRLKPGGFLALIMPRSFTVSQAGPETRKKLLEECDILELWELPAEAFQGATTRTLVIFAQKKQRAASKGSACVRTRTVQPATWKKFVREGVFTSSAISTDQSAWKTTTWKSSGNTVKHVIDYKTVLPEFKWKEITDRCISLSDCADITRGIAIGTIRKAYDILPREVQYLPNIRESFPSSFVLNYAKSRLLLYPHDCERPRLSYVSLFEGQKVILQYVQTPSWGERVKVAIERQGYYVSENFYAIGIRQNSLWSAYTLTNEILAVILDWDVSNAWIIEHMKSPGIPSQALETMPLPAQLSASDCDVLTRAVLILEREANAGYSASQAAKEAHQDIDIILRAAYHLDETTFKRLREVMNWANEPFAMLDRKPDLTRSTWFTSGIVDHVDAEKGTITLWIDGFNNELQTVNIAPSMPGWLLRPNAAFLTKIPREYRRQRKIAPDFYDWGTFYPQPYMYMSEEELLTDISKHFATKIQ